MNTAFPTLKEIQDVRVSRAPLTVDQMVKRIGDTVRLNYKNPKLWSMWSFLSLVVVEPTVISL
jgi:hypothetical protein